MYSLLKYSNGKFEVDNLFFSNEIVKQVDKKYACEDTVKELSYQIGNPNNCIYYTDGSVHSLSNFEEKYNEIILYASKFHFEENENLIKQQLLIESTPKPYIDPKEFFQFGLTEDEQQHKINLFKQYNPEIELNNEFYFNYLNKFKKILLKESDWTQLPDVQLTFNEKEKEAWINYRTSLRILDDIKDPLKVRLPFKP